MLGIPRKRPDCPITAMTKRCGHAVPTFGCKSCIDHDLHEALRRKFIDPKTVIPRCPECGRTMMLYDWSAEKMELYFACPRVDRGGESICGTEETI